MSEEPERDALADLLVWVKTNDHEEGVADFLRAIAANRGKSFYEIAAEDPEAGMQLAEQLFWMVEELFDDGPEYHALFSRTQPKPQRDERIVLP